MNSNAFHSESKLLVGMIKVLSHAAISIFQHGQRQGRGVSEETEPGSCQWPTVVTEEAVMTKEMHQRKFRLDINVYSMRLGKH